MVMEKCCLLKMMIRDLFAMNTNLYSPKYQAGIELALNTGELRE
jgi:hypothetical protein